MDVTPYLADAAQTALVVAVMWWRLARLERQVERLRDVDADVRERLARLEASRDITSPISISSGARA